MEALILESVMSDDVDPANVFSQKKADAYYGWVRQMMTLTSGELTLLVALKSSFVPHDPSLLWTLGATWLCLAASLLLAAVILWGEHAVYGGLASKLRNSATTPHDQLFAGHPPAIAKYAGIWFPWTLSASLVFLCVFAIANL